MLLRSTTTETPELVGLLPGEVVTLSTDVPVTATDDGAAAPVPAGAVAAFTVRLMLVTAVRACASLTLTGRTFAPPDVLNGMLALYEKMPSPATASPLRPSSWN